MTSQATRPTRSAAILVTVSGATFLAMLDSTVTNLAIPALQQEFDGSSVADLSWVITAYVVLFAALLPSAGRLADVLGRRTIFLGGVALFTAMSLACALAPTLPFLVGARALQGVGAAAMIPSALAILLLDGPPARRASAIGLWSAASAVAAAVGPALGGVLVDWLGWPSVFYINLPVGVAMLIVAARVLPRVPTHGRGLPDALGTLLLAAGIGAVTVGVTQGSEWGWWNGRTLGCLAGGVAAVAVAVWRSTRRPVPALETGLWRNRTFLATNLVSLIYGMAQFPWLLGTVLFMVALWRYDEMRAGFAMTPGALAASAAALLVGRAAARLRSPRQAALLGFVAFLVSGVWMVAGLTDRPSFLTLILPASLIAGFGMGAITYGTTLAAAMSAPPTQFAGASGMNTMSRQFGGALGVAALAVIVGGTTGEGLSDYRNVFLFCTVLVVVALALTWAGLRFAPPPAAAAAAGETTAAGSRAA
ncbi:DHA2 family efflux MFS transporter permease subunit [Micromonospora sp. WMMA1363]|uniref:DHA2 family efflux MFS transporter permease subunit n=1 Tax=Micromonospora sp. WMMA1363 TaxID=3053985 RepID=UPI00259CE1A1|nr:DHA2 family efflux MFS transporter permease subunit [Micromonospora sp. WMMA1363]MDM4722817.1 DHA2 family efflux MFS transporter permease subunit [Micromonospora sp. WMMA1363]